MMTTLDLYIGNLTGNSLAERQKDCSCMDLVHPEALAWAANVKKIMVATGVLENKVRKSSLWSPIYIGGKFNVRHLFRKLEALEIWDDAIGQPVRFFDMEYEQRNQLIDQVLADEAEDLSDKIRQVPQLAEYLYLENQYVVCMMMLNRISGGKTGTVGVGPTGQVALDQPGEEQRMKEQVNFDIFANYPHRSISEVRKVWKGQVRRGDILLVLPKHGCPWVWTNLTPRVTHKMGHLGIITEDIGEQTNIYSKCTVECMLKKGVHRRTMKNWDTPHYILGVQRVRWHWNAKGIPGFLQKEVTRVEDMSGLATTAEKFIGRKYVHWYEVTTCKWVAPLRFTCSTLVWWCAKKTFGFTLSNWLYAFTTPTDILRNPATYIKYEVK